MSESVDHCLHNDAKKSIFKETWPFLVALIFQKLLLSRMQFKPGQ